MKLKDVEIQQFWGQQTWSLCFAKISGLALPPLGVFYLWWGVGCGILRSVRQQGPPLGSLRNNPVLIGEPGVGKTAIAEGLAMRIVAGDRRLLEVSIDSIICRTKLEGKDSVV